MARPALRFLADCRTSGRTAAATGRGNISDLLRSKKPPALQLCSGAAGSWGCPRPPKEPGLAAGARNAAASDSRALTGSALLIDAKKSIYLCMGAGGYIPPAALPHPPRQGAAGRQAGPSRSPSPAALPASPRRTQGRIQPSPPCPQP